MSAISPFWNDDYSLLVNRPSDYRKLAQKFTHRDMKTLQRLIVALTGATAGGNATGASYVRVVAPTSGDVGGVRAVETKGMFTNGTATSRATTADDVALIKNLVQEKFAPSPYPVDRSGNGGGNKLGV